jgi:hypothetical protein
VISVRVIKKWRSAGYEVTNLVRRGCAVGDMRNP